MQQCCCQFATLGFVYIPGRNLAAEHVDHHVEVVEHTVNRRFQPGDIPGPTLVGSFCLDRIRFCSFLPRLGTATIMLLLGLMQNPVDS